MVIKSKSVFKSFLILAALSLLILSISPTMTSAATSTMYEKGALTSKPPAESPSPSNGIGLFGVYQLLFMMEGGLHDIGNGTVKIVGETITKQTVSQLGVDVRLERWTGTQWVSASNTYVFSASNDIYVYGSVNLAVAKGYYYRTVTTHTAKDGTINESHVMYSEDFLIPL